MLKPILLAAAFGSALAVSAVAQTAPSVPSNSPAATCDEKTFTMVKGDIDKMTDQTMKTSMMKEYDMGQMAMKDKKMDECMMHLNKARDGSQKR